MVKVFFLFLLAVECAAACNQALERAAEGSGSSSRARGDCHPVESERFSFHSDPWINLHHFLYQWARNVPERPHGDRRRAIKVAELDQLSGLDEAERRIWTQALAHYREQLVHHDLLRSQEMRDLKETLAAIACAGSRRPGVAGEILEILEAALPVYRRYWWPRHHAHNVEWIEGVVRALKGREGVLADRLAQAYGGHWPTQPVRVDVTAYANWAGAYTTNYPDHVTITSTTNPHITGLNNPEILLHEVSHASFFERPLQEGLEAAFDASDAEVPDGLSHALQWVNTAELLRERLGGHELDRFEPYAERSGLYRRSRRTAEYRTILEEHWVPYLEGEIGRTEALERVAVDLKAR